MKKLAFGAVAAVMFLSACQEVGPIKPVLPFKDSTYISSAVDNGQAHNVLLEEFTGVTCPNCPQGHTIIKNLEDANQGRIIAIGYYSSANPQSKPVAGLTKQDFRTTKATDLGNNFFGGINFLPSGGIDRVPFSSGKLIDDRNYWGAAVSSRLSAATPANVLITSKYDAGTQMANIQVKVVLTDAISKKLALSVAIVENNIIDAQENGLDVDTFYTHNHVMRDILTETAGTAILDKDSRERGRVYQCTFNYKVNSAWKPENCKVIAFVRHNEANDTEVIQANEANLK